MRALFVCGLRSEARIAGRGGAKIVLSGADPALLGARLAALGDAPLDLVISFGLAGGLAPGLKAGTLVIADRIIGENAVWNTDPALSERLRARMPDTLAGPLAAIGAMLLEPDAKTSLGRARGAIAADMESGVAAAFAGARGLPLLAIRAISDDAATPLPGFVRGAIGPDGGTRIAAIMGALIAKPREIMALPGLIAGSGRAHARLRTARGVIRAALGG